MVDDMDWKEVQLGDVLHVRHGKSQHQVENSNGLYPIFGTGGLMGWSNEFLYNKPSVLIGRKGTIDKPQYFDKPFWTIDTLFYTEIDSNVNVKYIYYLFNTIDWYSHNEASGVPSLNAKVIERISVLLPPLKEQDLIAQTLTDTDNLIHSIEKLIDKKEKIKQGTMQELLTGKKRLDGFSGEWVTKELGEIGTFRRGKGIARRELTKEGFACVLYGEIYTKYNFISKQLYSFISYESSKKSKKINKGDLLFTGSGETAEDIGKSFAYIGSEVAYAGGDIILMTPYPEFDSVYLGYLTNSELVNEQKANLAQGSSVIHIYSSSIKKIEIFIPSLKEQKAISQILSDMDQEIEALKQKLEKYKKIKQGMMQELLTGRIRLI